MILYLLVPALVLGDLEIFNTTEEPTLINQNISDYGWGEPGPTPSSEVLDSDSGLKTEDDERFQEEQSKASGRHCFQNHLPDMLSFCEDWFHWEMSHLDEDQWCNLDAVLGLYNNVTLCLERFSDVLGCFFPNDDSHQLLLQLHSVYFRRCGPEEDQQGALQDAPHSLVLLLTLLPVALVPVLVSVVVWRSSA